MAFVVSFSFIWGVWALSLILRDRAGLGSKGTIRSSSAKLLLLGPRENSDVTRSKKALPAFHRWAAPWERGGNSTHISHLQDILFCSDILTRKLSPQCICGSGTTLKPHAFSLCWICCGYIAAELSDECVRLAQTQLTQKVLGLLEKCPGKCTYPVP